MLILIFTVGVLTFLLGLLLAAYGSDIFGESSAGFDSYSRSLSGHCGLTELLEQTGISVVISRTPALQPFNADLPLIILEPMNSRRTPSDQAKYGEDKITFESDALTELLSLADDALAPIVIALPKRWVRQSENNPAWIESEELLELDLVKQVLHCILSSRSDNVVAKSPVDVKRCVSLQNIKDDFYQIEKAQIKLGKYGQVIEPDPCIEPILACDEGVIIGQLNGMGYSSSIFIISDPDLINNRGLARADHAMVIHTLLTEFLDAKLVVIDESLHGFTANSSLLFRALSFPLVLIVIHGLLGFGMLVWAASRRFGKALPPPRELPPGKNLLIDNTSKILLSGKNNAYAVRRYLRLIMAEVAQRFLLKEGASQQNLIERLSRISRIRKIQIDLEMIDTESKDRSLSPGAALRLAKKIHRWREELMGTQVMER